MVVEPGSAAAVQVLRDADTGALRCYGALPQKACKVFSGTVNQLCPHIVSVVNYVSAQEPDFTTQFLDWHKASVEKSWDQLRSSQLHPRSGRKGHQETVKARRYQPPHLRRALDRMPAALLTDELNQDSVDVVSYCTARKIFTPTRVQRDQLATGKPELSQPQLYPHHNQEPVFVIRRSQARSILGKGWQDRICPACRLPVVEKGEDSDWALVAWAEVLPDGLLSGGPRRLCLRCGHLAKGHIVSVRRFKPCNNLPDRPR